jgi:RNA polymerase sigma-70 factor (ECF subfamily)
MPIMSEFAEAITLARAGTVEAAGKLLEPYRNYLRCLAVAQMGRRIGLRVTPSDIVQDTMLAAHRDLKLFRGGTSAEFSQWLRTILARSLLKAIEYHFKAEKRDARRLVSIDQLRSDLDNSCDWAANLLVARQPTPSREVVMDDEARWISDLIARLPPDYQTVITLRNLSGLRFEEVAAQMERSPEAVRMLWLRAIAKLRELIPPEHRP